MPQHCSEIWGSGGALPSHSRLAIVDEAGVNRPQLTYFPWGRGASASAFGMAIASVPCPSCNRVLPIKRSLFRGRHLARARLDWKDTEIREKVRRVLLQFNAAGLWIPTIPAYETGSRDSYGVPSGSSTGASVASRTRATHWIRGRRDCWDFSPRLDLLWGTVPWTWFSIHLSSQCYRRFFLRHHLYFAYFDRSYGRLSCLFYSVELIFCISAYFSSITTLVDLYICYRSLK